MIRHYFQIALRHFQHQKWFTLINVLGLSVGISAAIFIFLISYYEFNYDTALTDGDRIYKVVMDLQVNGTEGHAGAVPAPLGSAVTREVPGLEAVVPVFQFQGDATANVTVHAGEQRADVIFKKQKDIVFTNNEYFQLLPFEWLEGRPQSALNDPFKVVITESKAKKYFPGKALTDVIGQQLVYDNNITVAVSGIVGDLNVQTSFEADEFISLPTIAETQLQNQFMMQVWNDWMAYVQLFVKLREGSNPVETAGLITGVLQKNNVNSRNKDFIKGISCNLQPANDFHYNANYAGFGQRIANIATIKQLFFVALFLLLLGAINFVNLTTAQSSKRAREIGVRKVMGSQKTQLVVQFMGEAFLLTAISALVAVGLIPLLFYFFEDFVPAGLLLQNISFPPFLAFFVLLVAVVGFLSGMYPAMILSKFKPVNVLKGADFSSSGEHSPNWMRKLLTVSQFVIAQAFMLATIVVGQQLYYAMNRDLGFNKEAVISFELPRDSSGVRAELLLNAVRALPEVSTAATGFLTPAAMGGAFANIKFKEQEDFQQGVQIRWGDPAYLDVFGIKLLAGRNVQTSEKIDEFIVNEAFAKLNGYERPGDAVGHFLEFKGQSVPIVGVLQDFHDMSLRTQISPLVFGNTPGSFFHIRLKANGSGASTWPSGIQKIKAAYAKLYPAAEFEYHFFDETIAGLYEAEHRLSALLKWASGLTIFISCLGLFGLVLFTIQTRTKEIGIRKVLGASVAGIVRLLSVGFLKLVFLAFLFAAPTAYYFMDRWLDNFAYRIDMKWWMFAGAGATALLIAFVTVSVQSIRAALANPVKSLRSE